MNGPIDSPEPDRDEAQPKRKRRRTIIEVPEVLPDDQVPPEPTSGGAARAGFVGTPEDPTPGFTAIDRDTVTYLPAGWVGFHGLIPGQRVDVLVRPDQAGHWTLVGLHIESDQLEMHNDGTVSGHTMIRKTDLVGLDLAALRTRAIPARTFKGLLLGRVGRHATDTQRKMHRDAVTAVAERGIEARKRRADVIRDLQDLYSEGTGHRYTRQAVAAWLDGYGFTKERWSR